MGAWMFSVMTVLLDGWLLRFIWSGYQRPADAGWQVSAVHAQEKAVFASTGLLGGLVLVGAGLGVWAAGSCATRARRRRNAALGALAAHLVLPVLAFIGFALHPPTFVW